MELYGYGLTCIFFGDKMKYKLVPVEPTEEHETDK